MNHLIELSRKVDAIMEFNTFGATRNLLRDLASKGVKLTRGARPNTGEPMFPIAAYDAGRKVIHVPVGGTANTGPRNLLWHEAGHAEAHSQGLMDDFLKMRENPALRSARISAKATGNKSPILAAERSEARKQELLANNLAQKRMEAEGVPRERIQNYRDEQAPNLNTYRAGHREAFAGKPGANFIPKTSATQQPAGDTIKRQWPKFSARDQLNAIPYT